MRASTAAILASHIAALWLAACATPQRRTCSPASSWAAPAYHCELPDRDVSIGETSIELREKIEFETDSARIAAGSRHILDQVVTVLNTHPDIAKVRIDGHTDSTSTPEHNQSLSEERAAAVKAYLVEHGVAPDRLSSQGFGQTKPIADNNTDAGRADNRRVEIRILQRTP